MPETAAATTYRIELEAVPGRVAVVIDGVTVADSADVVVVHETHLPSVYYFPPSDVARERFRRSAHRTFCPFKGTATHWSLELPSRTVDNAAWSYDDPLDASNAIGGYVGFYANLVDQWIADAVDPAAA